MKRMRVSIADLMAAVVLFAIDLALMRSSFAAHRRVDVAAGTNLEFAIFALGVLPMASILLFLGLRMVRQLAKHGRCSPFWVGFQVVGAVSVLLFVVVSALSPWAIYAYANGVLTATVGRLLRPSWESFPFWLIATIELSAATAVFLLPQLMLAALGGWLARRWRVTLAIEPAAVIDSKAESAVLGRGWLERSEGSPGFRASPSNRGYTIHQAVPEHEATEKRVQR